MGACWDVFFLRIVAPWKSQQEIKKIVDKRTDFEYRLQKSNVNREDFLRYVEYELALFQLMHKRKKQKGLMKFDPKIDFSGVRVFSWISVRLGLRFEMLIEFSNGQPSTSPGIWTCG